MPATFLHEITDQQIADRLSQVLTTTVEWTGWMPRDAEKWNTAARERWADVDVAAVRRELANDLSGDDAQDEIDMAISMACEPEGLPDNAAVSVMFCD